MMDFQAKIHALRYCVETEGDDGIAWFGWQEREELQGFIDEIEERLGREASEEQK